jgi:hypothetical protein
MTRRSIAATSLISVAILTGCSSEHPTNSTIASSATPTIVRAQNNVRGEGRIAQEFRGLAEAMPGFTGVFFDDDGVLTIAMATDEFPSASVKRVVEWAAAFASTPYLAVPRMRRVKYGYLELSDALAAVHALPGVSSILNSTAIDETKGVLQLGLSAMEDVALLSKALTDRGIPRDMLVFEQTERAVATTTLNQRYRPLVGGLEITNIHTACTLGFNFLKYETGTNPSSSPKYFITAGHCSADWGEPTGIAFHQVGLSSDRIGQEIQIAPIRRNDPYCPSDKYGYTPCTDADVLVGRYDDTVSVLYGSVATVYMESWRFKQIHGYINVQGTTSGALTGQTVFMQGKSSGQHNNGKILQSCGNVSLQDKFDFTKIYWVMCTQRTDNVILDGDSGAPFFIPYNASRPTTTPSIVGIAIASNGGNRTWLSPIGQIDMALGGGSYFYW